MGLYHAIGVLAAEWAPIRADLDDDAAAELEDLATQFVREPVPDFADEIAEQIARLLCGALPAQHPFCRALNQQETRWASGTAHKAGNLTSAWLAASDMLRQQVIPNDSPPTMDEIRRGAAEWLLAADAFDEAEMIERGQSSDDVDLIRLERQDGRYLWPAFQFDGTGQLLDLIRRINRILDVQDDPWGVADWWLGANTWLRGVPAELIGQINDQDLIDAAFSERAA